jgi:LacI family transcriptional regulator
VPVTIVDVARLSGVSIKQVSRVINHEDRVARATRARVLQAVGELGFVPNVWARRLARGYSNLIGLCMYSATPDWIMVVLNSMIDVADCNDYRVAVYRFNPLDTTKVREMLAWSAQRHIDGLILTPPIDSSEELVEGLTALNFPFVQIAPHNRGSGGSWVATSDEPGSYDATRHLLQLGHTRIAFIQGPSDHLASWDRLHGYQRALREEGIDPDPGLVRCGDWSFETGIDSTRQLMSMPERATAIVCSGDQIAAGAIHAVRESGLDCPADVSVTGFNDIELAQQIWPPLTTVRQPVYEIATTAMTLLIEKLIPGGTYPSGIEIPTTLIVRASTGPAAAHK